MAIQTISATVTAASSVTFVFAKPAGAYGKLPGLAVTDGGGGVVPNFLADVDNMDGTMMGTAFWSAPVTGSLVVIVADFT